MSAKLKEGDVIDYVCQYLKARDHEILQKSSTIEHGIDIIAQTPDGNHELWVEAKGQTSSDPHSNRYLEGFSRGQEEDHLGKAILKCLNYLSKNDGDRILTAIAVPADDYHNEVIPRIYPFLTRLGIAIFLVDISGDVKVLGLERLN